LQAFILCRRPSIKVPSDFVPNEHIFASSGHWACTGTLPWSVAEVKHDLCCKGCKSAFPELLLLHTMQGHPEVPLALSRSSMDNSSHELLFLKRARMVGRLSIEGRRASFDHGRLSTEARRRSMEGRPTVDGRRSSLDRGRPSIDGSRLSSDRLRASLDTGRCSLDRGRSFDRSGSAVDGLAGCEHSSCVEVRPPRGPENSVKQLQ
jgi:hypothetical protein